MEKILQDEGRKIKKQVNLKQSNNGREKESEGGIIINNKRNQGDRQSEENIIKGKQEKKKETR